MKKSNWLAINSWALYDFANTIFSLNIISLYYSLWIIKDLGVNDLTYSIALSVSMLFVAVFSPMMGNISDKTNKRIPFIVLFTVICCFFTAILGMFSVYISLFFFVIANFSYNMGLVFYNALLPDLSTKENIGKVSGYGTAIGYVGSIVGLLMVMPFVTGKILKSDISFIEGTGNTGAFLPTAVLFLVFSLPLFLIVKDKNTRPIKKSDFNFRESFDEIKETIKSSKKYPGVLRYLIANFFFFDAVNTVIAFMGIYSTKVAGLDEGAGEVQKVILIATVAAIIGSYLFGLLTDKIGPKKALNINLMLWGVSIILLIIAPSKSVFYYISMLIGINLGGTWTTSRPLLSELVPEDEQGKFFGLYSLAGKFAAIIGPMVWGIITFIANEERLKGLAESFNFSSDLNFTAIKYQLAIGSLLILLVIGMVILRKVPDTRNSKLN